MSGPSVVRQAGQAFGRSEQGFQIVPSASSSQPSAAPAHEPSPASFASPSPTFFPFPSTSKAVLPSSTFPAPVDPNPFPGDAGKEWAESGSDEEQVVLSSAAKLRSESKLSSPSPVPQRRVPTSTSSSSARPSSVKTVHLFPLEHRYFSSLQAFYLAKNAFAAEAGIKLYSGGGPEPTVFVCADGRSRKKTGDSRTACPYKVAVSRRAQGGYEIDEERSNWMHVGHELKPVDESVVTEGAAFAGPAEDESTSPAPSTSSPAQPSQASPLPFSIRQPVSNAFFPSPSSSSKPIASSPSFTRSGLLGAYAQSLAAQVNDQAALSQGQASKKDASTGNVTSLANKLVGIEALRRKRARSSLSSAEVVPDKGKGKQIEETHVLQADIDLTLSGDEEEDVKPNLASSSPLPAPTPSKRVKREPSSSSSARRTSFAGSSSAALPSSDQHPSFSRPPSIRSVADFLASLEKDKHVGFARLAPYFEAAGFTTQRLEAVEAEDVDDLVQIVMEEATRGRGGPLSGAERHDWNTLGRRMVARK